MTPQEVLSVITLNSGFGDWRHAGRNTHGKIYAIKHVSGYEQ